MRTAVVIHKSIANYVFFNTETDGNAQFLSRLIKTSPFRLMQQEEYIAHIVWQGAWMYTYVSKTAQ